MAGRLLSFLGGPRTVEDRDEVLPPEIVLRIFHFLPGKDVLTRAALTCKYWHGLTLDQHLWRGLCARDVEAVTLLSLLQPEHQQEKDYTPTDLALIRSRDAFLQAKPDNSSWQWLWRAQNMEAKPSDGTMFTGIGFGMNQPSDAAGSGSAVAETRVWQYCGEWKDGKRHGYGKCIWNNGTWYTGFWQADTRHGQGKIVWPGGGYYEGGWKDGYQEGSGVLHTRNGFTFEGEWSRNELSGEGSKYWFENGKREVYKGAFLHTKAHGYGHRQYGNGATYEGMYDRDRRVGRGVYTWPSGHRFVGEWQVGRRNGHLICPDGREFEQTWKEDRMQADALHAPDEVEVVSPTHKIRDGIKWLKERR